MYLMMYISFSIFVKVNNFRDGCIVFIYRQLLVDEEDKLFYCVYIVFNCLLEVFDIILIVYSYVFDMKMGY